MQEVWFSFEEGKGRRVGAELPILWAVQSHIVSGPIGNGHPMHRSFMSLFSLDSPI